MLRVKKAKDQFFDSIAPNQSKIKSQSNENK